MTRGGGQRPAAYLRYDEGMLTEFRTFLLRDLEGLRREIALYPDDDAPWRMLPGFPNSGGNLALHLAGNLRHFVGAQLGGTGYVRTREAEFESAGLTRAALDAEIQRTVADVDRALTALDPARLDEPYPLAIGDRQVVTRLFLLHLTVHLAYHLGQIDYHRRAVTGDLAGASVISLKELLGA